jgi:hypothetical protein
MVLVEQETSSLIYASIDYGDQRCVPPHFLRHYHEPVVEQTFDDKNVIKHRFCIQEQCPLVYFFHVRCFSDLDFRSD